MKTNLGLLYALCAYTWWGIIPIFWKQLDHVDSFEIVLHRMVWACLLIIALIVSMREWREFTALFKQRKLLGRLFLASLLVSLNWAIYIWAVNSDQIVEASMGYFINPLISVLFGVLFFSERLRKGQAVAILLASIGVAILIFAYGEIPIVALSLAITFALYGVIKKTVSVSATHGMALETLFMFLPAAAVLLYWSANQTSAFGQDLTTDGMLILAGLFTLIPLILFAAAAKKISLTALGMSQYVGPFLQLAIGVFIYHEPFGTERMWAFGLVWAALLIYSIDQLNHQHKSRRARRSPAV